MFIVLLLLSLVVVVLLLLACLPNVSFDDWRLSHFQLLLSFAFSCPLTSIIFWGRKTNGNREKPVKKSYFKNANLYRRRTIWSSPKRHLSQCV
jgi:hypothetical protein